MTSVLNLNRKEEKKNKKVKAELGNFFRKHNFSAKIKKEKML